LLYSKKKLQAISGGSTFKELSKSAFLKFIVLYPPFKEQQKIADILSKVDEQIELAEKIIDKTEELKKGLMQKLFTKGIYHNRLKEIKIGLKDYELPDTWEVKTIEETSFLKARIGWQGLTTKEYLSKGDYILVTGTDFKDGLINWDTCVYVEEDRYLMDSNIQLKNEDILVTKDGTIGKIAFVDYIPKPATLNSGVFVLRSLDGEYHPKFFYYILKSFYFDYFMNILKAGSTISHLYQRDFVKFKFPVPSIDEQKQIASILSKVDEQIQDNKKELKHLKELKKGLMQDLLTGKVGVTI
jgi:type I restriction enzyme S subunit